MRVTFMGTPGFSAPVLQALVDAGHEIVAVYSQPPRPAGRGQQLRPSPVHRLADTLGLEVRTPKSLKDPDTQAEFAELKADVAVVVAYGLILPGRVLRLPKHGCINIHASLLPRWRGAAPIHRAIMAGDKVTGVSIMQMEAGLDTGPVLVSDELTIRPEETTGQLHDRLSTLGAELIVDVLKELPTLRRVIQPDDGVTYASKISKSEAQVDWSLPAEQIDRMIRGLSPFPGAWCDINGERVKLLASRVVPGRASTGVVLGGFKIACRTGAVEITVAQRPGKKAMSAEDFLKGYDMPERLDSDIHSRNVTTSAGQNGG